MCALGGPQLTRISTTTMMHTDNEDAKRTLFVDVLQIVLLERRDVPSSRVLDLRGLNKVRRSGPLSLRCSRQQDATNDRHRMRSV